MDKDIERLSQDLARARYTKRTCTRYVATARGLCAFTGKPVADVERDDIRRFMDHVLSGDGASSTKNHVGCALRFLYRRTLGRPEMVSFLKLPKIHSPLPVVLSKGEVNRLLNAIRNPRYQSMAMVMYGTGLRIAEARVLTVNDIDRERQVLIVRHGKGDKARETKLSPVLYDWLRADWARRRPPLPYLFADAAGRLPLPSTVREALKLAAEEANIRKRVTPHVLRHTFATHLLEEGTDVRVVSALLGHAQVTTTARYARVTEKIVRQTPSPLDLLPQPRR
jgi:integrase/recombinase XerD